MTTIRELVLSYAGMWVISRMNDPEKKYQAEAERIMAQIESYYVPRPEGSVTVTQAEYDALLLIYMAAEAIQTDGITSQTIHGLELAVDRYTEMMAGVE